MNKKIVSIARGFALLALFLTLGVGTAQAATSLTGPNPSMSVTGVYNQGGSGSSSWVPQQGMVVKDAYVSIIFKDVSISSGAVPGVRIDDKDTRTLYQSSSQLLADTAGFAAGNHTVSVVVAGKKISVPLVITEMYVNNNAGVSLTTDGGGHSVSAKVGDTINFKWSSVKPVESKFSSSFSSRLKISKVNGDGSPAPRVGADPCGTTADSPWVVSSESGSTSVTIQPCQAGYGYDYTFSQIVTDTGTGRSITAVSDLVNIYVRSENVASSVGTSSSAPKIITGVQGFDASAPVENQYTDGIVNLDTYLIAYGSFGSDPAVTIDGLPVFPVYKSEKQLNIDLRYIATGSHILGVKVKNASGVSSSETASFSVVKPKVSAMQSSSAASLLGPKVDTITGTVVGEGGLSGNISLGSRGADVKVLQQYLKAKGLLTGKTDGVFGKKTAAALKILQEKAGLEPTGKIDPLAWQTLIANPTVQSGIPSLNVQGSASGAGDAGAGATAVPEITGIQGFDPVKGSPTENTTVSAGKSIVLYSASNTFAASGNQVLIGGLTLTPSFESVKQINVLVPSTLTAPSQPLVYVKNTGGTSNGMTARIVAAVAAGGTPTCSITGFSANPLSVTLGQPTVLSWSYAGCSSVTITDVGAVSSSRSQSVTPTSLGDKEYKIVATSKSNTVSQSVVVSVKTAGAAASAPVVTSVKGYNPDTGVYFDGIATQGKFIVIKGAFAASGNSVVIRSSAGGTAVTPSYQSATQLNVPVIAALGLGSSSVIVTNDNGSSIGFPFTISATDPTPSPAGKAAPHLDSVNGYKDGQYLDSATSGGYIVLFGTFAPSDRYVHINNGPRITPAFSSQSQINVLLDSALPAGTLSVSAEDANGSSNVLSIPVSGASATGCSITSFTSDTITATTNKILSWYVSPDCVSVSISNIGTVSAFGSMAVSPSTTTTYTLTAKNASGVAVTKDVIVTVGDPTTGCSITNFTSSPTTLTTVGQSATLTWATTGCTVFNISNTSIVNGGNIVASGGSTSVAPSVATTYVLTARATSTSTPVLKSIIVTPATPSTLTCSAASKSCTSPANSCGQTAVGTQTCSGGVWSQCSQPIAPSESSCQTATLQCATFSTSSTPPTGSLCVVGTASSVNLDTVAKAYVWSCGSKLCSSPYGGSVNGVCGIAKNTEAPYPLSGQSGSYMCYTGTVSNLVMNPDTSYSWKCQGSGTGSTPALCQNIAPDTTCVLVSSSVVGSTINWTSKNCGFAQIKSPTTGTILNPNACDDAGNHCGANWPPSGSISVGPGTYTLGVYADVLNGFNGSAQAVLTVGTVSVAPSTKSKVASAVSKLKSVASSKLKSVLSVFKKNKTKEDQTAAAGTSVKN
jgi:Putative peptidoglycan binding domain